jgi:hypothetical protein
VTRLYHYTCAHAAPHITRERWLQGNPHPWLPDAGPLVHLTDLDTPDRSALGLTSNILLCDRTEYRVTVSTSEAVHWPVFARTIPRHIRRALEEAPGAMPMHWYVVRDMPVGVYAIEPTRKALT